jgi:hypothetical protein
MTFQMEINEQFLSDVDKHLARLEQPQRWTSIKGALRAAGGVVVKRCKETLPKPGYPGDKKGLKPLRETLGTKVVEYQNSRTIVALVGFAWGAGSHGHLVEKGHRLVIRHRAVGTVEGRHYLEHAADATKGEQDAAILGALQKDVEESKRG